MNKKLLLQSLILFVTSVALSLIMGVYWVGLNADRRIRIFAFSPGESIL